MRRVEDITEALWGERVSPSTVSELNQKIYAQIEAWRNRPIEGRHAYVYLDGIWLKRSWGGEVKNVAVLVAIGVREDGYREILRGRESDFRASCDLVEMRVELSLDLVVVHAQARFFRGPG